MLIRIKGTAERVVYVPCFFTGNMVKPTARITAERVRDRNGKWVDDGHVISVHVDSRLVHLAQLFAAVDRAPVCTAARDGHQYRLVV